MTPYEKLTLISEVIGVAKEEIEEFWQGVNVRRGNLTLDGDSVLLLYFYIAARAQIPDIHA